MCDKCVNNACGISNVISGGSQVVAVSPQIQRQTQACHHGMGNSE